MKRTKRKYTRHDKAEPTQGAPGLKISSLKEESRGNLSPDILASIEKTVELGKLLGLPDDRQDRIQRALRYQEFIRGKNDI